MSSPGDFENLEVAVVIVTRDEHILMVFNPRWGAYTLPMTKRRMRHDTRTNVPGQLEDWEEAALRARAESVLGTTTDVPKLLIDDPEYQQSDRDGQWKRFHFQVFKFEVADSALIATSLTHEWLTPQQILDESRGPISKTARDIVARVSL